MSRSIELIKRDIALIREMIHTKPKAIQHHKGFAVQREMLEELHMELEQAEREQDDAVVIPDPQPPGFTKDDYDALMANVSKEGEPWSPFDDEGTTP